MPYSEKVYVGGTKKAGVSSLVKALRGDGFDANVNPTTAIDRHNLKIMKKDKPEIGYELWEASTEESYASIQPVYMKGASVGVFCVNLQELNLKKIGDKIKEFTSHSPHATVILVGTKNDGPSQEVLLIRENELKQFGNEQKPPLLCVVTSAKEGNGINEFKDLLEAAVIQQHELLNPNPVKGSKDTSGKDKKPPLDEETIGVELLKLTTAYAASFQSTTEIAMKQSSIADHLFNISKSQLGAPERVQKFYDYLKKVEKGETKSNMELIKEDNRVSAKNFVLGVVAIFAIVATGVVPGLVVIGLTGKNPLHLFESPGQTFLRNQQHFKDQMHEQKNPDHEGESAVSALKK